MSTETERAALRFLSFAPLLHADMTAAILNRKAEILSAGESGVLLRYGGGYMMSALDNVTADAMLELIPGMDTFDAHQKFYVEAAQKKFGLSVGLECRQAVWIHKEPLPEAVSPAEIRLVGEDFLPFLMRHYTHADINGEEYLWERLGAGGFFAAFVGGEPAGFIGMHEEGSMGMLEVLPEYRRKGIAAALETFQANRILARGGVPFAQIELDNKVSFALHRRLGFSISEESLFWLF